MVCADSTHHESHVTGAHAAATHPAKSGGSLGQRLIDLERRNEELESFIRALAHDSGSLTRGIGLQTQLLRDRLSAADDHAIRLLENIEQRAVRLAHLTEGLMRLTRIGCCDLDCTDIDLSAIATEVLDELRRVDPHRKVRVEIQPGLVGWGDPALVRLALDNLLGNAWKYTARTDDARIEVGCRSDLDEAVYFVADNGVGFSPDHAAVLFSPFGRLASAQSFPGCGLGLATVKRVIERHGGWVRAASDEGRGSAFLFSLGAGARRARKLAVSA